jgi:hypothetical protein
VVFANDTAYYAGRPVFRATRWSGSSSVELATFTGYATATLYPDDSGDDYVVAFDSPHKIVSASMAATGSREALLKQLLQRKVLAANASEYNASNLQSAIRAGVLRERPDLETEYERASEVAEESRHSPAPSVPSSSGSSSSSTSGASSAQSAQHRFANSPSVRNTCTRTIHVFVGDKPPYSSGVSMTVSGNSINASLTGLHSGGSSGSSTIMITRSPASPSATARARSRSAATARACRSTRPRAPLM